MFFFGLFDFRRPWKLVHLDLLVLLSFGISHFFFNRGEIGVSVPLVYPPLVYLLIRMLWIGFRGLGKGDGLRPSAPIPFLAVACLFLIAFRVALNIADSGVIDVGYAGVIGAERITHGEPIYGENAFPDDNPTGDTYGPANYYAYVPFEAVLPWSGEWDNLPAAHAAAIFFDLATVLGLFVLGGRLWPGDGAGRAAGTVLAFAWLAYPYTAFALQSNSNDSLVAALLIWGLVFFSSPMARGGFIAAAAMTKFAPLALVPLYGSGSAGCRIGWTGGGRAGRAATRGDRGSGAFVVAARGPSAHPAIDPGLATFWDRTAESQLDRESPFSVWGQEGAWLAAGVLVGRRRWVAVVVAFVPRRRGLGQVAALAAAVLIASQLAVDHWFYLYLLGSPASRRPRCSIGTKPSFQDLGLRGESWVQSPRTGSSCDARTQRSGLCERPASRYPAPRSVPRRSTTGLAPEACSSSQSGSSHLSMADLLPPSGAADRW